MRGFLQPAISKKATEAQDAFRALSRHRRSKLAKAAQTTLVKADRWSRGAAVSAEIAGAMDRVTQPFSRGAARNP
jgi:hypothetical protein